MSHNCGKKFASIQEVCHYDYYTGEFTSGYRVLCKNCNSVTDIKKSEAGAILAWVDDNMSYVDPTYDRCDVKSSREYKS